MDVAHYEDFLSHLRNLPLHQTEWAYPAFVKSAVARKAYRVKEELMRLGTKNVGTSELASNR